MHALSCCLQLAYLSDNEIIFRFQNQAILHMKLAWVPVIWRL
jgi:hypothetical protein